MNRRMIGYIIGKMMGVEALVLLLPALMDGKSVDQREVKKIMYFF